MRYIILFHAEQPTRNISHIEELSRAPEAQQFTSCGTSARWRQARRYCRGEARAETDAQGRIYFVSIHLSRATETRPALVAHDEQAEPRTLMHRACRDLYFSYRRRRRNVLLISDAVALSIDFVGSSGVSPREIKWPWPGEVPAMSWPMWHLL